MTINGQQTMTPLVGFLEKEPSMTLMKWTVVMLDGKVKEYVLKTTKDGKLVLN